jgi:hypothetical protein
LISLMRQSGVAPLKLAVPRAAAKRAGRLGRRPKKPRTSSCAKMELSQSVPTSF